MGLTPEQFLQVRRAMRLAEVPAKNDAPGKRNSARWSVDAIVGFAPCREGTGSAATSGGIADIADAGAAEPPAKWVSVIDLSPTGASVLSRTQFAPGEYFVLALPSEGEAHLAAVCLVQYSRVKLDGTFRIGAEFRDASEAGPGKVRAALDALRGMGLYVVGANDAAAAASAAAGRTAFARDAAGRAEGGSAAEPQAAPPRSAESLRRSERRLAEGRAVIHTYEADGEPGRIEEVPALDFSETGVCIFRREPLKVGDHFMARVPVLNSQPIISLCRVTNVAAVEGGSRYRIGAEFVRPAGFAGKLFKKLFGWLNAA